MASTQELTRRIKSVKSTRKVTRAMQMVSAAKMRKSQAATLASRSYAELAWGMLRSLSLDAQSVTGASSESAATSLLTANPKATRVAVVVISTNRGLVGGFNANLFIKLRALEQEVGAGNIDYIVMGKKAAEVTARTKKNLVADFSKPDALTNSAVIQPIVGVLTKGFTAGTYKTAYVVYNHFISTLTSETRIQQLLPLVSPPQEARSDSGARREGLGEVIVDSRDEKKSPMTPTNSPSRGGGQMPIEYEFEPTPELVLEHLLPRILESQMYQAVLESDAAEHSSRMIMMKNATESAGDIISDLTLTFNQLRQNKITTELSEITAGKIALEEQ